MKPSARVAATFNRSGSARNDVVGVTAMPAVSRSSKGTGAPSSRRARATIAAFALAIAAFAITAAPASAAVEIPAPPTVSNVSYASAHISAQINPGAFAGYSFQLSTDGGNTWTDNSGGFAEGGLQTIEAELTGLKGTTTYSARVRATFGFTGEALSPAPNPSFTTLTADSTEVVSIANASDVAYTTATATGEIDRPVKSNDVTCNFEYIGDDQYLANPVADRFSGATPVPCDTGNPAETPGTVKATGHVPVSAKFTGLGPSTTYHLRLAVSNAANADAKEAASTFTTLSVDPPSVVSIENAGEVEYTQARVKGVVERPNTSDDAAFDVNCNFEYIADAQFKENEEVFSQPGFTGAIPVPCTPNPVTAADTAPGVTKEVEATFSGLTASTTYHLRLSAANLGGSDAKAAASTFITEGPIPAPSVISIDDAGEVDIHTAKVKGIVERPAGKDPGLDTNCRFEYVTDQQFAKTGFDGAGLEYCAEAPPWVPLTTTGPTPVSAELTGLKAGTTFHLRLAAENVGGTVTKDAAGTFTTLPASNVPTVTIDPVAGGTFTTAHVSGIVSGDGICRVEISTDDENWTPLSESSSSACAHLEYDIAGLQPSTTYYFRIIASFDPGTSWADKLALGDLGYSPEPNPTITTEPLFPPTAENLAVTDITATSAHFSGTVTPNAPAGPLSPLAKNAYRTKWHFECTPECKDANGNEIGGTIQGEEGPQTVTGDVKRLEPGTEYEVRLIVSSEGGGETKTKTFPTDKSPPSVNQTPGAPDGEGGYTLQGVVNPNNETITDCEFKWGPDAPAYAFSADCSPLPIPGAKPTTVEAHLTGLNSGAIYHSLLVVTYGAGLEEDSGDDHEFEPTVAAKEPCPANEQQRAENGSLALLECRAYEMVTPPGKEGFGGALEDYGGGATVAYKSNAGNFAKSGQSNPLNFYVAQRSVAGWETIPNLNGSSGSLYDVPFEFIRDESAGFPGAYSPDLLSSVWFATRSDCYRCLYLRSPDGTFALIGSAKENSIYSSPTAVSSDLSHLITWTQGGQGFVSGEWGPGIYEFVGTGMDQPRRVDLDNAGSSISSCLNVGANARGRSISADGSRIVLYVYGGCGGANPPADELWARVNGTTSFDVSASHCSRLDCNAPSNPTFEAATPDGSRVFFTTTQQLVDEDVDQTNDIYACDIPSGSPAPTVDKANPCAAFRQVSGAETGASVESVGATSENGATVLFTAKGKLADNEDALKEKAVAGDHNLYIWRIDAAHPDGQTIFLARLDSNDVSAGFGQVPQITPDGRYLVFTTASQLVPTDTDNARDVYRYDADTGDLIRASTNVLGVAGNGDAFDARTGPATEHHPSATISDDGKKIVFTTAEALSPADGNAEPDVYLWTPARVSLISTGSSGYPLKNNVGGILTPRASITGTGQDIYFESAQPLTPADGDDLGDVYDARIDGGFRFTSKSVCTGEKCQPEPTFPSPSPPSPANTPNGEGNVKPPKPCPDGKVRKKNGKCVKKTKRHSRKKHHGRKAGHSQGGGK